MSTKYEQLTHYSSSYYDPVKAHEYYMKTRELKGRRSTRKLNSEGKEKWSYVKNEIKEDKKESVEDERDKREEKIKNLRDRATITRTNISEKLKHLNEVLSNFSKTEKETIDVTKNNKLENLKNIKKRKGLSDKQKAQLNAKMDKIREDAKTDKAAITEDTKNKRADNSSEAKINRDRCTADLKTACTAAREAYKLAKASLDVSYEKIYQEEFDKIAKEYSK